MDTSSSPEESGQSKKSRTEVADAESNTTHSGKQSRLKMLKITSKQINLYVNQIPTLGIFSILCPVGHHIVSSAFRSYRELRLLKLKNKFSL